MERKTPQQIIEDLINEWQLDAARELLMPLLADFKRLERVLRDKEQETIARTAA